MAFVQPLVIQQQEGGESVLDKVLKGVQLANGIVETYENIRDMPKKARATQIQSEQLEDTRSGYRAMKDFDPTKTRIEEKPFEGATVTKIRVGDEVKDYYVAEKKAPKEMTPYEEASLKLKERELGSEKAQFAKLPIEVQEGVKSLAQDNANKISIKTQIDSAMSQLKDPEISQEQKLTIGNSLIKTLNSTQGKDAVGAEESKRLAPFLSPQGLKALIGPGNVFTSDIDKFIQQVGNTSDQLGMAIRGNTTQLESLRSGQGYQTRGLPELFAGEQPPASQTKSMNENPNYKGDTIKQGTNVFKWNPKTGTYE